jgi:acyl-CoA thioesterase
VAEVGAAREAFAIGPFERDTAVRRRPDEEPGAALFDAEVADGWKAGRGPHGGYLAAMLLRALTETVDESRRAPRSLTIHYARAPEPGPVVIRTRIERAGRSLSTLSARMEQDGRTVALVLSAFSVPWAGPEIDDLPLPDVEPPDPRPEPSTAYEHGAPPFTRHLVIEPRIGDHPFGGQRRAMKIGSWIGLAEARPLDAPALAFFSDGLIPSPFMATGEPAAAPTIDLTVHFRVSLPRHDAPGVSAPAGRHETPRGSAADTAGGVRAGAASTSDPDPHGLCYVEVSSKLIQEGFFEEDGVIWARDGTVLAQSRQLAVLLPQASSG